VGKEGDDKCIQENVILKVSWLVALKRAVLFNIAIRGEVSTVPSGSE
jgi:hypothetical protein